MKYAIFGAGEIAERVLLEYWEQMDIVTVFDNYLWGVKHFHGLTIRKPQYIENIFVIVCSRRYYEIRKQLIELGYSEFSDFTPYQIFDKKMAIAYGNCHMAAVREYLARNREFSTEYGFYPFPLVQEMNCFDSYAEILPHCELFIHQSIRKENKFGAEYSSDRMISFCSPKCKICSIPNLYGMPECFFPQQKLVDEQRWGKIYFMSGEDENVKRWVLTGKTEQDIKQYMVCGGVYNKEDIQKKWEEFKKKLLNREKEWDVKISDYIFQNYQNKKLFYEKLHISDVLVREIASRTLKYLGYEGTICSGVRTSLDARELFIYKDVMEALGLEFEQKYIRQNERNDSLRATDMDMDEYIHQLCKWILRPVNNETRNNSVRGRCDV